MTITRTLWNPFSDLEDIYSRYNRAIFVPQTTRRTKDTAYKGDWAPAVDIAETKEAFIIEFETPGVERENIAVSVDEGILTIQGERKPAASTEDRKQHRIERFYGTFTRQFSLPENINEDNIRAEYKNGILALTLFKTDKPEPKSIEVQVH